MAAGREIMAKVILGLGALFLYGSLGMASGVGEIRTEETRPSLTLAGTGAREVESEGGATVETAAGSTGQPIVGQRISEEERERRVQECERLYEACYDWCSRSKGGPKCYTECSKKNTECMGKIPYAVKD
jgi:hypothetical protein